MGRAPDAVDRGRGPADGSMELFRVATADGRIERLTTGHQYVASFDQVSLGGGRSRTAWLRASATDCAFIFCAANFPAR